MKNNKVISVITTVSLALTFYTFNVKANDCSISINSEESVKCLQRKITGIENQLHQSNKYQLVLPKGAVVAFNVKSCPDGWTEHQSKKSIVTIKADHNIIMCEKLLVQSK